MGPRNFREYPVWKESVDFASLVYEVTGNLPWFEKKGLSDQLQRAVVSISSNIAEGSARASNIEFARFLDMALGSAFEVETQLTICRNIKYISDSQYNLLVGRLNSVERQLNGLIHSLREQKQP